MSVTTFHVDGQAITVGGADLAAHEADTTNIHGIPDMSLLATRAQAWGGSRFVSPSGSDSNDGRSPGTPKQTIAAAALSMGAAGVIYLLPGTHTPASTIELTGNLKGLVGLGTGRGSGFYPQIAHAFDGPLIRGQGSQGVILDNLDLVNNGSNTGTALLLESTSGSAIGTSHFSRLNFGGSAGFERNVVIDGSANSTLGARSCFFHHCIFFGATSGENVTVERGVHIFFTGCDIVQSPAAVAQELRVLDEFTEDVFWSGKILGSIYTEAGVDADTKGGCFFSGTLTGDFECAADSDNQVYVGVLEGGFVNNGGSGNLALAAGEVITGSDSRLTDQRVPTDSSVTAAKVHSSLKPSGSATASDESLRRLGTGGTHAAAGDDSRFPTAGEKNALAGEHGTPGSLNKYLTKQSLGALGEAGKALEADKVAADVKLITTIRALGPSLHLALDDDSGLIDLSGNLRHGTGGGSVSIGGAQGVRGGKITDLDGSDDIVTTSYNPFANGVSRTFGGVAYRDTSSGVDCLFGSDAASNMVHLRLSSGSNDVVFFPANAGASTWSGAWPGNGQLVFWALVFREASDAALLYINGSLVSSQVANNAFNASPGNLKIGARGTAAADAFDGKQGHFFVAERELTAAEIAAIYAAGT